MPTPPFALSAAALLAQCRQQMIRGSGAGGQHRNRTSSAVRLTHLPTGLEVRCEEHREHARNLAAGLERLRIRLAIQLHSVQDAPASPAPAPGPVLAVSPRSERYPQAVAAALAALAAAHGSLPGAAHALGVSSSRLVRLLTADKEVHAAANLLRVSCGCGALHG